MNERPPLPLAVAGGVVATLLGAVSGIWEAFLTPLTVTWTSGGQAHYLRLPVALLCAVLGNAALAWFAYWTTGRMLAVAGPFLAWTVPMVLAALRTSEGDLVVAGNNWVAMGTLLLGSLPFGVVVYLLTMMSLRHPRDRVVTEQGWREAVEPR